MLEFFLFPIGIALPTIPAKLMWSKGDLALLLSFCFLLFIFLCQCNILQGFGSSCVAFSSKPSCEDAPDNFCEIIINCPGCCLYSDKVQILHSMKNFRCCL
jgi:hypothetical protein